MTLPAFPLRDISVDRLRSCYRIARDRLLAERNPDGHWTGELSISPLSTATAVVALHLVSQARGGDVALDALVRGGLRFLAEHQNTDGGWGDTLKSFSNISTTMLAHAAFHATTTAVEFANVVESATAYIDRAGGVPALAARYGKDRTFSVPILTHCALAGLVDWRAIPRLPFELACVPHRFYAALQLPVVSYALPALIAIGQVRHHFGKPWNPVTRILRDAAVEPSLRKLAAIQPTTGGFLEATPLTAFVTMSLAGMGRAEHSVAKKGVEFLVNSVRADGSWPIDTNLATWVTTLAVNALGDDLPHAARPPILEWLLGQQCREVHPYTNAAPGGWAWTDLAGGVPDADDTPGALLALRCLYDTADAEQKPRIRAAAASGVRWLCDLQNRDGGMPTFCKGWGALPFDRSAADLTAHAIRAFDAWLDELPNNLADRATRAVRRGVRYLVAQQRPDGAWLPLWFGNQHAPDNENPTYGTSRVLLSMPAWGDPAGMPSGIDGETRLVAALQWLVRAQNSEGGWGSGEGKPASVEETALAVEALLTALEYRPRIQAVCHYPDHAPWTAAAARGLDWLMDCVETGRFVEPSPIGFYFAKLWYFEKLYPLVFTAAALRRATRAFVS